MKMLKTVNKELEGNTNETSEKTPPKETKTDDKKYNLTPSKDIREKFEYEFEFRTPEKIRQQTLLDKSLENRSPIKSVENFDLKSEQTLYDGEDGMISTTEQARLLIAARKTPSKSANKTPVKQNTPNGKKSVENSPVTPGKYRRVELITLESPKAKKIKKI